MIESSGGVLGGLSPLGMLTDRSVGVGWGGGSNANGPPKSPVLYHGKH